MVCHPQSPYLFCRVWGAHDFCGVHNIREWLKKPNMYEFGRLARGEKNPEGWHTSTGELSFRSVDALVTLLKAARGGVAGAGSTG